MPIHDPAGTPIGVLDIDSHHKAHFDDTDARGYELVVKVLEQRWNNQPDRT